jgi:hypothetical protein
MKCDVFLVALRWKEAMTTSRARKAVREATEDSRGEFSRLV